MALRQDGTRVRSVTGSYPALRRGEQADRHTRAAEEEDAYGARVPLIRERVAWKDMTLLGGVPSEEVIASDSRGWAPDALVAEVARAYAARKHAPHLMAGEALPAE